MRPCIAILAVLVPSFGCLTEESEADLEASAEVVSKAFPWADKLRGKKLNFADALIGLAPEGGAGCAWTEWKPFFDLGDAKWVYETTYGRGLTEKEIAELQRDLEKKALVNCCLVGQKNLAGREETFRGAITGNWGGWGPRGGGGEGQPVAIDAQKNWTIDSVETWPEGVVLTKLEGTLALGCAALPWTQYGHPADGDLLLRADIYLRFLQLRGDVLDGIPDLSR